jgi:hypothetical protein
MVAELEMNKLQGGKSDLREGPPENLPTYRKSAGAEFLIFDLNI